MPTDISTILPTVPPSISEIVVTVLILTGTFFLLVGSLGLARLPDLMRRLHAPTKATTLGIGALLVASMLWFDLVHDALSFHELLIALFLFMTAPVSAHMIAKAHILRDVRTRDALPPVRDSGWATLTPPAEDPRHR